MTTPSYDEVWTRATGHPEPFPYQRRMAEGDWPGLLSVPTGLGKTAAVGVAWIYRRMMRSPGTPRRLVYCLPMRVLAEQTVEAFRSWLSELDLLGAPGQGRVSVSLLMGGEEGLRQAPWALHPEEDAVLVGTQDMLLSRALMRGYGMSRYQWPVHFALLHNDALWVFDEVQLMGPALSTSAQLEAFRRRCPGSVPSRSLWLSATLRDEWLATVDFGAHLAAIDRVAIGDDDRTAVADRLDAVKRLHRAEVVLDREGAKAGAKKYVASLAGSVLEKHENGEQTLVIVNRVERAQALTQRLGALRDDVPILLVHARFRPQERIAINDTLRAGPGSSGRIIVATQAVEAGVDISSRLLFAELAPWSSMVQRFGRCNRYGEQLQGADIFWIDIPEDANQALPYENSDLSVARGILEPLSGAGPSELPPVSSDRPPGQVLRWKDLLDLFDTDPDLSGFDIDVAPYIRDQGTPQVQVFWRSFESSPSADEPGPSRDELCPASIGQIQAYLGKKVKKRLRSCWMWDPLMERWERMGQRSRVLPGSTLLLRAEDGGYDSFFGFVATSTARAPLVEVDDSGEAETEAYSRDPSSRSGRFLELAEHLAHVERETIELAQSAAVSEQERRVLGTAALWHDVGKAHPAFQTAMLDYAHEDEVTRDTLWAKSSGSGRLRYRIETDDEGIQERPYFRHELASMLAWLANAGEGPDVDLVAYLIAAHHGKVRLGLRALPAEPLPPSDVLFARGVWDGDTLPPVSLNGRDLPPTVLRLDIMRLGRGEMGPSWTERTHRLLDTFGPFRLAWLEALLRIADWRASAEEEEGDA